MKKINVALICLLVLFIANVSYGQFSPGVSSKYIKKNVSAINGYNSLPNEQLKNLKKDKNDYLSRISNLKSVVKNKNLDSGIKINHGRFLTSQTQSEDSNSAKKLIAEFKMKLNDINSIIGSSFPGLIKEYKDSLKQVKSIYGDSLVKLYSSKLNSFRIRNSIHFCNSLYKPKAFNIFDVGRYDVDTLDSYIFGKSNINLFQSISFQKNLDDKNSYISGEIASAFFGIVRVGLEASFVSSNDTAKDNTIKQNIKTNTGIQKILSAGGNLGLNVSFPLYYSRSSSNKYHFGIFAQNITGTTGDTSTLSSLNSVFTPSNFVNQTGLIFHFDASSNDRKYALTFDLTGHYTFGSKSFYAQYNLTDYSVLKGQFTFILSNSIMLKTTGVLLSTSSAIQKTPWSISFGIDPNFIFSKNN